MTKGSYTVGEDGTRAPRKDTSYRSFICALLIFLCICLIVLLASIKWGGGKAEPKSHHGGAEKSAQTKEETENVEGNEKRTNDTFEKMRIKDEVTTEKGLLMRIFETTTGFRERVESTTEEKGVTENLGIKETENPTTENEKTTEDSQLVPKRKGTTSSEKSKEATTESESVKSTTEEKTSTGNVGVTDYTTATDAEDEKTTTENSKLLQKIETTTSSDDINETTTESERLSSTLAQEEDKFLQKIDDDRNWTTERTTSATTRFGRTEVATESSTDDVSPASENQTEMLPTSKNDGIILTTSLAPSTTSDSSSQTSPAENFTTEKTLESSTETKPTATPRTTTTTHVPTTSTTEVSLMESESITESMLRSSLLTKSMNPVCQSPICKTASSRILSMMNHSAEPCDDFYEFACGRSYHIFEESSEFVDAKLLEKQLGNVKDTSAKFLKDFKEFYESCLEHESFFNYSKRIATLEALVEEVGQFQLNESGDVDLTDLVSSLLLRQSMPLFDIGLDVDKQSSNLILQLNLPQQSFLRTSLDNWSGLSFLKNKCLREQKSQIRGSHISLTHVYTLFQICQRDYSSYLNSVESVIRELDAFSNLKPDVLFKAVKDIRFNIEFDVLNNLDSLPPPATILSHFVNKNYEVRKISDLQIHYPIFDWKRLFETLTGREVQDSTTVQVYFFGYFTNMLTQLARVDKTKLNNAFLAIYSYDLFLNTVVPKDKSRRNSFCVDLSKRLLPDVWTHLVQNSYPVKELEDENKQVINLFEGLKKTLCRSLTEAEWVDDNTKVAVVKKCNNLHLALFTPLDETSVTDNYQNLNITADYQTNLITLLANHKRALYATQGKPISVKTIFSYFLDPLSSKPLTFYSSPMIAVPLGLMKRAPRGLPDYLVQTRVGFALARQMARHFDQIGMTYGVKLASSSKTTFSEFVHVMQNLMDYSSPRIFHNKNISFQLDGTLSINERIVDNTAFRLIFDSLSFSPDDNILPWISSEFSREKVFFIATAQEMCKQTTTLDFMLQVFEQRHLPAVLRVENLMGNSKEFFSKFSCPDGSGMDFYEKLQFPFLNKVEDEYEENDNLVQSK